jgi:hypothetical protein
MEVKSATRSAPAAVERPVELAARLDAAGVRRRRTRAGVKLSIQELSHEMLRNRPKVVEVAPRRAGSAYLGVA